MTSPTPNDGGPAFPRSGSGNPGASDHIAAVPGMSMRDYFAAAALTGLCAKISLEQNQEYGAWLKAVSEHADAIADAMIKARTDTP